MQRENMCSLFWTFLTLALVFTSTSAGEEPEVRPKDSFTEQQIRREDTPAEKEVSSAEQVTGNIITGPFTG